MRSAVSRRRHQRLHLYQERSHSLHRRRDGNTRQALARRREQHLARVGNLAQAVLPHLVNTQFRGAAEAVLLAAKHTIHIVLVALKLQHRVHDMLQHFRTRQRTFFVDMPDDEEGDILLFGKLQNPRGALAHLAQAADARLHALAADSLYGVYHHHLRLQLLHIAQYAFKAGLAHDIQVICLARQPLCPQFQLPFALLAAGIKGLALTHLQEHLQCQCRFAYPGLTAEQHQRPGH